LIFKSAQHVLGNFFAHPQERKTVIYSVWYKVPVLWQVGDPERGGLDYVFGVKDVAQALYMLS
jgi:hypothetical protein